jgi:hypothetical protein
LVDQVASAGWKFDQVVETNFGNGNWTLPIQPGWDVLGWGGDGTMTKVALEVCKINSTLPVQEQGTCLMFAGGSQCNVATELGLGRWPGESTDVYLKRIHGYWDKGLEVVTLGIRKLICGEMEVDWWWTAGLGPLAVGLLGHVEAARAENIKHPWRAIEAIRRLINKPPAVQPIVAQIGDAEPEEDFELHVVVRRLRRFGGIPLPKHRSDSILTLSSRGLQIRGLSGQQVRILERPPGPIQIESQTVDVGLGPINIDLHEEDSDGKGVRLWVRGV